MDTEVDGKYLGALAFVENTPKEDLARFTVQQTEAVNGLNKNNSDFIKTFRKMSAENARLRTALEDIANPLQRLKRNMPEGYKLDGHTTTSLLNSVDFYKDIARQALNAETNADEH